jgi:hypothetical protein
MHSCNEVPLLGHEEAVLRRPRLFLDDVLPHVLGKQSLHFLNFRSPSFPFMELFELRTLFNNLGLF